jgi:hypothetical protein
LCSASFFWQLGEQSTCMCQSTANLLVSSCCLLQSDLITPWSPLESQNIILYIIFWECHPYELLSVLQRTTWSTLQINLYKSFRNDFTSDRAGSWWQCCIHLQMYTWKRLQTYITSSIKQIEEFYPKFGLYVFFTVNTLKHIAYLQGFCELQLIWQL